MENRKQKLRTSCDSCTNYVYDEEYEYYVCEVNLDEDGNSGELPVLPEG